MDRDMEWDFSNGKMGKSMMENGNMIRCKDKAL
jgi:hypothetical protein